MNSVFIALVVLAGAAPGAYPAPYAVRQQAPMTQTSQSGTTTNPIVPVLTQEQAISLATTFRQQIDALKSGGGPEPPPDPVNVSADITISLGPDGGFDGDGNPLPEPTPDELAAAIAAQPESVALPVPTEPAALFPMQAEMSGDIVKPRQWQPRWGVTFPDGVTIDVVDATGQITGYHNAPYYTKASRRLVTSLLTENQAIAVATSALRASGQSPDDFLAPYANLRLTNDGEYAYESTWVVMWQKKFHNIPYLNHSAMIHIDAETGEIGNLCLINPTAPPTAWQTGIDSTLAVMLARAQLAAASAIPGPFPSVPDPLSGLPDNFSQERQDWVNLPTSATLASVTKVVTSPNTFWQNFDSMNEQPVAKVVWQVDFLLGDGLDDTYRIQVMVDFESGQVIGGWYGSSSGVRGTAHKRLVKPSINKKKPAKATASNHPARKKQRSTQ